MKSNRAYWLCQILGWGGYSLLGFSGARTWDAGIGYALYFFYSIALTHLLRAIIRRRGWLDGPATSRCAFAFLSAWLIGWIEAVLVIGIDYRLVGRASVFLQPVVMGPSALAISFVPVGWMTLYLVITSARRTKEKLLALRDAELRALELQINPHFLFNSLNSIRGLVIENPPLAQDLITRLANILRYNLHRDAGHTVSLDSELEAAADYLALERARYEDRLRIHYDVAPETRGLPVPPMLVQTLVENAIKHGIATLPQGGDLHLSTALENSSLLLRIENEVGQASSPVPGRNAAAGLGLQNLRERLRILYGPAASLALEAAEGRVTATVRIPANSQLKTGN